MNMNARPPYRCIAGVFTAAAIALVAASVEANAQRETAAEGRLAFEAATIKLAAADAVRNRVVPISPNRLSIPSMTLTALIYAAYGEGGVQHVDARHRRSGLGQQDGLCRRRCRIGPRDAAATADDAADPHRGAVCVEVP